MRIVRVLSVMLILALGPVAQAQEGPRVLVIGDSVAAWNRGGVARALQDQVGGQVVSRAKSGANISTTGLAGRLLGGEIPDQLTPGPWDWVVIIGGANDLIAECRCGACQRVLDSLISADGRQGEIPSLVARAQQTGARIVWADYYLSNRALRGPRACILDFEVLEDRTQAMAQADPDILWVDMETVINARDRSDFALDRVHPSATASAKIGQLIAAAIQGTAVGR